MEQFCNTSKHLFAYSHRFKLGSGVSGINSSWVLVFSWDLEGLDCEITGSLIVRQMDTIALLLTLSGLLVFSSSSRYLLCDTTVFPKSMEP